MKKAEDDTDLNQSTMYSYPKNCRLEMVITLIDLKLEDSVSERSILI